MISANLRRGIGMAAVLMAAAAAMAGTTAAASPTSNSTDNGSAAKAARYQDYGVSVDAAASDQCAKPVSKRTGAWFCPAEDKPKAKIVPNETGFCNFSGCYTEYNNRTIDFKSDTDYWGYGDWNAGTITFQVQWKLDGGIGIVAKPVILETSIPVQNVHFSGDMFNPPPGKIGTQIPGSYYPASAGNSDGIIHWPFPDQGYEGWDNENFNRTCVIEASWGLSDYPGYWYVYVKSPIASSGNGRNTPPFGAFYFRGANQLPKTPFVGNYRR